MCLFYIDVLGIEYQLFVVLNTRIKGMHHGDTGGEKKKQIDDVYTWCYSNHST